MDHQKKRTTREEAWFWADLEAMTKKASRRILTNTNVNLRLSVEDLSQIACEQAWSKYCRMLNDDPSISLMDDNVRSNIVGYSITAAKNVFMDEVKSVRNRHRIERQKYEDGDAIFANRTLSPDAKIEIDLIINILDQLSFTTKQKIITNRIRELLNVGFGNISGRDIIEYNDNELNTNDWYQYRYSMISKLRINNPDFYSNIRKFVSKKVA